METRTTKGHPENRGDRNPLRSRRLRRELHKNRFVPNKKTTEAPQEEGNTPSDPSSPSVAP